MNTNKITFETKLGYFSLYWDEKGLRGTSFFFDKKKNSEAPSWVKKLQKRIEKYYQGVSDNFRDIKIVVDNKTEFQKKVYEVVRNIPRGKVLTYKEVAFQAGSPLAFRAIGQIMARNPFPLIVPCHRVVGSGKLGGFSAPGGLKTKCAMLKIENFEFDSNKSSP